MIRKAEKKDLEALTLLVRKLWPGHSEAEIAEEMAALLQKEDAAVFLLCCGEETAGFAQCGLRRDYVEGTSSSPVGYLEGIYVDEPARGRGAARQLLHACENWARDRGCREFASDCELDNETSRLFHLAAGFEEANRIICFTRKL